MRANLHVHTTISDGHYRPKEVVDLAKKHNVDAIAVTDHDAVEGIKAAFVHGQKVGVQVIPGIEISCEIRDNEIHILGYGIDNSNEHLRALIEGQRTRRFQYIEEQVKKVNEAFNLDLTQEEVCGDSLTPTKAHIASAMVKKGVAKDIRDAIENHMLKGGVCYVDRRDEGLYPIAAIDAIHRAGGVAVWAHPLYPLRTKSIHPIDLLYELRRRGLDGIEFYFDYEEIADKIPGSFRMAFETIARERKMLLTGGSDFHGYWLRNSIDQTVVDEEVVNSLSRRRR